HVYDRQGTFLAVVQVSDGRVTEEAKRTVTVGSLPPVASIDAPPPYATYAQGETIHFSGSATDPDEGVLSPGGLRWTVVMHHNDHEHAYLDTTGTGGSFVANGHGVEDSTVAYEIVLTATDASGLSDSPRVLLRENRPPAARAGADWST